MIHVGEGDHYKHKPVHFEILHRAHKAGLAGASVFRGFEGYGIHSRIHTTHILSLASDLPIVIVIIDEPARIDAFLLVLDDLLEQGTVTVEDVKTLHYGPELNRS